jgi:coatomer subunit beta'
MVAVCCENSYYILQYNAEAVQTAFAGGASPTDGIEDAFELKHEISEKVVTATWVGETLIYTNSIGRLQHLVGGEVMTIAHLERPMFLLGYIPKENRLYLIDKENAIISYTLLLPVVEYQTAILREDFEAAEEVLPQVPTTQYDRLARFLEAQGHKEQALQLV